MANGLSGNGVPKISEKAWISIGFAISLATIAALATRSATSAEKDIEHLQETVGLISAERDAVIRERAKMLSDIEQLQGRVHSLETKQVNDRLAIRGLQEHHR